MKSDYFEKIQKRYDELAKEGYGLVSGQKFYESLLKELPNVPEDTYCTHEFMFRIHERMNVKKDQSFKSLSYRLYNSDTFEWSEWRDNDFNDIDNMTLLLNSSPSVDWKPDEDDERSDIMWGVILKDKRIYILNIPVDENSYVSQLAFYAPELLREKYVRKSDNKEIGGDIFPWLYIYVGLPALRYPDTPVGAQIFSMHDHETTEESRHSFALQLVDRFSEVYRNIKWGTDAYKKTVKNVEDSLARGVLPAAIVNAPVHINYDGAMFTPAQGLQFAPKRIEELEQRLNEINPEFLRLKEILDMSPEEKENFIKAEEAKEAKEEEDRKRKKEEARKKKAEERKRKEEEARKEQERLEEEKKQKWAFWKPVVIAAAIVVVVGSIFPPLLVIGLLGVGVAGAVRYYRSKNQEKEK